MPEIHLIERLGNYRALNDGSNDWESGYWVVAQETAARLVGGQIYLHDGQDQPSRFGGNIASFRVQGGGELDGRIIFRFTPTRECKGASTDMQGWGNEKKIVL